MKIMTFNTLHCLNYTEKKIDFQIMADAIKSCGADIVGLNEMRDKGVDPEYDTQTAFLSELTGMKHYYFAKAFDVNGENPYGNAILSKYPIISAETIAIPDPGPEGGKSTAEPRCLLKAKIKNNITVLITHFDTKDYQQKSAVATVLENIENERCILMGDFNLEPDNEILDPIRERMKDAADMFDQPLLSFPSDYPDRKIDYIFATPDVEIISADIPTIIASDHRPHTAVLNMPVFE